MGLWPFHLEVSPTLTVFFHLIVVYVNEIILIESGRGSFSYSWKTSQSRKHWQNIETEMGC